MAFEEHWDTSAYSLFNTNQRLTGVGVGGSNVALPFDSIPSASLQDQDTISFVPGTHDDPRKLTDAAYCDGETDLQHLVSNILDEANSQDSLYCEGRFLIGSSIWSPKTSREELFQGFQSEAKTQHQPSFLPNIIAHETFSKAQQQSVHVAVEEFSEHPNGLATSQQWLFSLPNGDNHFLHPQKLPPGLPNLISNTEKANLSQMQQSNYKRGNGQSMNNFHDQNNIFKYQSEMNSSYFDPFYEDHEIQSSRNSICNEQYVPEDINQQVSSFQSLMPSEHDTLYLGDFSNMYKQRVGMHHEDNMTEQWKIACPAMQSSAMYNPKLLVGEFGTVLREQNGKMKKQTFKHDTFQDVADFIYQNTSQQPKPFSAPKKLQNQYQNKMTLHGDNNVSMNQYLKHPIQQSQMQNNIKPQMQKEKMRMHTSGPLGESFSGSSQSNTYMRVGDKQSLSHIPYFDFQQSMQSRRVDGETSMVSAGNAQQFTPVMYPANDLRRHSSMPFNSHFSPRLTLPNGRGASGMNVGDKMSANESTAFNSYAGDMKTHRGESMYHGKTSAVTTSVMMNQGGPLLQFSFYLDECYEQWRHLENERRRTEIILMKTFAWKRTAALTNTNLPKASSIQTRLSQLIVSQAREQAKVSSLLDGMVCLYRASLPINIHTALSRHQIAICVLQARSKDILNMSKHQQQRPCFTENKDTTLMTIALKDLASTTRKLCTALWCALQMTLPKPIKMQDDHVNEEATSREQCDSPFKEFSFII